MMKGTPIAVITGDVHHPLTKSFWDQREAYFALEYSKIALELDVKITLFVTGRCVEKYSDIFRDIKKLGGNFIEFGGHTYNAFLDIPLPMLSRAIHLGFKAISGRLYGPRWYQRHDIRRTISAFEKTLGIRIKSWRTHMYESNSTTYRILHGEGFRAISDKRVYMLFKVKRVYGDLYEVYITAPPDGVISPTDREWNKEWRESFWNYIKAEVSRRANIVVNLHPKRMAMLDNFKTFREILIYLKRNGYTFMTISEVVEYAKDTN